LPEHVGRIYSKTVAGYKEFHDYLASSQHSDKAFSDAVKSMKLSTRQYAKRQVSWLRNKLLPVIYSTNANSGQDTELTTFTYLLDATGQLVILLVRGSNTTCCFIVELGDKWNINVRDLGQQITEAFLAQQDLPDPKSLSVCAQEMLTVNDKPTEFVFISFSSVWAQTSILYSPIAVLNARRRTVCSVCTIDSEQPVMIEEGKEWELHQKSRTHRKLVKRANRLNSGQQRHATGNRTESQRASDEVSWQNLDESVTGLLPP
jgi:tRNA dimethylallyltransferase